MAILLALVAIGLLIWGISLQGRLQGMQRRFKPVMDAEQYAQDRRKSADLYLDEIRRSADEMVLEANKEQSLIEKELSQLRNQKASELEELARIKGQLAMASDASFLVEVGYYEPRYEFEELPRYEAELALLREEQKRMLREDGTGSNRSNAAAYATGALSFNGSATAGRAAQKKTLKLMLRAFNGESDSFIARVNYRNIEAMQKRIRAAFETINAITEKYDYCSLNTKYMELRIKELELVCEYEEAKQKEKEEQAKIREQMREEERAQREIEKARQQAEKENRDYGELLAKARADVGSAAEKDKARLNARIAELEARLAEVEERRRAISQAELTKTGCVYVISNVGSFGNNVFKIGMTRRLESFDRVKELGDASVPFPFDVHAMIRTSDAPALERALHRHFDARRLNLENQRKEFFRVSIEEIREELEELRLKLGMDSELHLTLLAEAKEYRISEAKRKHLEAGLRMENEEG